MTFSIACSIALTNISFIYFSPQHKLASIFRAYSSVICDTCQRKWMDKEFCSINNIREDQWFNSEMMRARSQ
jgi:hypothetical protein